MKWDTIWLASFLGGIGATIAIVGNGIIEAIETAARTCGGG